MLDAGELALVGAVGILAAGYLVRSFVRRRQTPEEKERQRRALIYRTGRMGDANIIEIGDNALIYKYSIGGLEYTAAQDITFSRSLLPGELDTLIGPATVKYMPRNPFNSILICEEWTGLRKQETYKKGA